MSKDKPVNPVSIVVSQQFQSELPPEPVQSKSMAVLSELASTPDTRASLVCNRLLVGETRQRAQKEASQLSETILMNTQILAVLGKDAIEAVNALSDRIMRERPPVNIPELRSAMKDLARTMRGVGKKYDPSNPAAIRRYEKIKNGATSAFFFGKTFIQEFLDDVSSLQKIFDRVTSTLEGKQYTLLKNVSYYDVFYGLNEAEITKLIYKIGVMEIVRDLLAQKASKISIGDSNMGDRGSEDQARISELVTLLENRIIAFKSRLWVAWAMAPQIRYMRSISVGLSARIDQTIDITIPTMKNTIVIWQSMSEAQQAEQFNRAVEQTSNEVMTMFANAAKAGVPAMAKSLASTALDPKTIAAWADSLQAQAEGIVQALDLGRQKRAELEQAMIAGKQVIDAATQKVNQKQLESVLAAAQDALPIEVSKSVSA